MADSKSGTQTYASVSGTATQAFTLSTTTTGTITQQISRYLADDLRVLLKETRADLADVLGIPPEERNPLTTSDDLAELICNDIEQMLRDQLITAVHFLLSDLHHDPNTFKYNLKYHVQYQMDMGQTRTLASSALKSYGDSLNVPTQATTQSRLVILIDWSRTISEIEKEMVAYPRYFFDWRPPSSSYDASRLVRYDSGGLGTVVVRTEFTLPGNVPTGP